MTKSQKDKWWLNTVDRLPEMLLFPATITQPQVLNSAYEAKWVEHQTSNSIKSRCHTLFISNWSVLLSEVSRIKPNRSGCAYYTDLGQTLAPRKFRGETRSDGCICWKLRACNVCCGWDLVKKAVLVLIFVTQLCRLMSVCGCGLHLVGCVAVTMMKKAVNYAILIILIILFTCMLASHLRPCLICLCVEKSPLKLNDTWFAVIRSARVFLPSFFFPVFSSPSHISVFMETAINCRKQQVKVWR